MQSRIERANVQREATKGEIAEEMNSDDTAKLMSDTGLDMDIEALIGEGTDDAFSLDSVVLEEDTDNSNSEEEE